MSLQWREPTVRLRSLPSFLWSVRSLVKEQDVGVGSQIKTILRSSSFLWEVVGVYTKKGCPLRTEKKKGWGDREPLSLDPGNGHPPRRPLSLPRASRMDTERRTLRPSLRDREAPVEKACFHRPRPQGNQPVSLYVFGLSNRVQGFS